MLKRGAIIVGAFLLATLVLCAPVGILGSSNIVWGEDNQYGKVPVPGTKVLHLPEDTVDVSAAMAILGKGNETVDVPIPANLTLRVVPVGGGMAAVVHRDLGDSTNAMDDGVDSQRRVFKVDVPHDGDYRVTAAGTFLSGELNPQLWFGHGPPIPGTYVPFIAAGLALLGGLVLLLIRRRRRSGERPMFE